MRILRTYARVLGMLRPDRSTVCALAAASVAVAAAQCLDPILFGRVIGLLANAGNVPPDALWADAARLMAAWGVFAIAGIAANMAVALFADRMAHRSRMRALATFFGHALNLPAAFHGGRHSGELSRVMFGGSDSLFALWLGLFREQLVTFVTVAVLLPVTIAMNWRLSLVLVALSAIFCLLTTIVVTRTLDRQAGTEHFHRELARTANDVMANAAVVRAFTRAPQEKAAFSAIGRQVLSHQFPVLTWWAMAMTLTRSASTVATLAVVVAGTALHLRGLASVGEVVSFMGFSGMLVSRLESIVWFVARLFQAAPGIDEWFAISDQPSSLPDRPDAPDLVVTRGEVRFENVSFAYPGTTQKLTNLSFTATPGRVVALVGRTGAGKSTTISLLQRAWDPSGGRILIDGQDIRDVSQDSLRASIGTVFQDSLLFDRSIRDNVRVGRPGATDAEVEQACRMAEAHDFIQAQPHGYDTVVGERGGALSGGQKQRLSIARALLKNAPILVLDEATSALDAATEAKVAKALQALAAGRTTFVVAHRLSTIIDADEILVFEGGRVVEHGTFEMLTRQQGIFHDLVQAQLATRHEDPVLETSVLSLAA